MSKTTLISTIAIKFLEEKGGRGSFVLKPLVSRDDVPDWVTKTRAFKEAREKGLVRATQDAEQSGNKLDPELVKKATKLKVAFTAKTSEAQLEKLVVAAEAKLEATKK